MIDKDRDVGLRSRPVENVADYPRPPRVERVKWGIRVELGGHVVAETRQAIRVIETFGAPVYYIPPGDVRAGIMVPEAGSTFCEWKGSARYWTLVVGGRIARRAAWSYPDPAPDYAVIRDHLAFYVGKMDACWVDDDRAVGQPGGFYGGWLTPEIRGPVKGSPGTGHW